MCVIFIPWVVPGCIKPDDGFKKLPPAKNEPIEPPGEDWLVKLA